MRDEPVDAALRFAANACWIADLSTGEVLGSSYSPLHLRLEPSWGRVLALLPCREVRLDVQGPESARQGERVVFDLEAFSESGGRVDGAFTAKVNVTLASGRVSGMSGHIALDHGLGRFELPIGANEETGEWSIAFEGGFPRRTIVKRLEVSIGAKEPVRLLVRPVPIRANSHGTGL